ncbi:MAG: magnesium transporter CorA family protein [Saprospiraceae bacterium]|nr:magnesium transporter CorA family protein [Saprospiraceae bacterium]
MIRYYTKTYRRFIELEEEKDSAWIHIAPPFDQGELSSFAETHDIPLDFLVDSLDIDERSRYEREENANLILFNTPLLNEDIKDNEAIYYTVPIGIILVRDKIVTITSRENPIIEKFLEDRVKNFDPKDAKLFVLQLFEQNVLRFLECLKKLNLKRNLIEQELYNSSKNRELKQLLRIEKSLVYFVNSLSANELLKMKMKRTDLLNIRDLEYHSDLFEDVIIDNSQALEMSNVHTNILGGTMETYASIISNNMNAVVNRLTVITITLMVPTLVYSFYGMNVDLPLMNNKYAYVYLLFISICIVLGFLFFINKKR